jgi:large subunit ribosomal protein L24
MKIKKDDNVIVLAGKDKGKTGKVIKAMPKENRVVVAGINMFKKNQRPRQQGQKGQIVEKNGSIHVSNVALKK